MPGTEAAPQRSAGARELPPADEAAAPPGATKGSLDTAMQALTTFIGEPPDEWTQDQEGDLAPFVAACRALDLDDLAQAEAQCLEFYVQHGLRCPIKALQLASTWQWAQAAALQPGSPHADLWETHEPLHRRLGHMQAWIGQCLSSDFAKVWQAWVPVQAPPPRLGAARQPAWIVSELEALQLRLGDVSLQTPSLRAMRLKALRGVRLEWITLAAALCCAITMGPLAFLWWVDWAPGMVGGYTKSFQVACMAAAGVLSLAWGWMTLTVHRLAAQTQARVRQGSLLGLLGLISHLEGACLTSGAWTWTAHVTALSWLSRQLPDGLLPVLVVMQVVTVTMACHGVSGWADRTLNRRRSQGLAAWRDRHQGPEVTLAQMARPERSQQALATQPHGALSLDEERLKQLAPEPAWWRQHKAAAAFLVVATVTLAALLGWLGQGGGPRSPMPGQELATRLSQSLSPEHLARMNVALSLRPGWNNESLAPECARLSQLLRRSITPYELRRQVLQSAILRRTDLAAEEALDDLLTDGSPATGIQLAENFWRLSAGLPLEAASASR